DDADVAAAAAQRPEQVGVRVGAGFDQATVGGDDVGFDQVVEREAEAAREVAEAAAEGEPGHAGGRDDAGGRGQAEGMRGVVDVAPERATADARGAGLRVDVDVAHGGEVDDQAAIDGALAGDVVAAAANGEGQIVVAGEAQ